MHDYFPVDLEVYLSSQEWNSCDPVEKHDTKNSQELCKQNSVLLTDPPEELYGEMCSGRYLFLWKIGRNL